MPWCLRGSVFEDAVEAPEKSSKLFGIVDALESCRDRGESSRASVEIQESCREPGEISIFRRVVEYPRKLAITWRSGDIQESCRYLGELSISRKAVEADVDRRGRGESSNSRELSKPARGRAHGACRSLGELSKPWRGVGTQKSHRNSGVLSKPGRSPKPARVVEIQASRRSRRGS